MFEQGLLSCSGASQPTTPGGQPSTNSTSTPYDSRVVSLGSFSKIMCPGLRLGWIEACAPLLQRVRQDGVLGSGGSIAPLASGIAHSCLELGLLQQHLHGTVRPALQRNCAALCEALQQELPAGCRFTRPAGGYFVWVQLPDQVGAEAVVQDGAGAGLVKAPGWFCHRCAVPRLSNWAWSHGLCLHHSARQFWEAQPVLMTTTTNEITTCLLLFGHCFLLLQVSQDLLSCAADNFGVKFTPGRVCDGQAHMLRLSFAFYSEQELREGAQRLGAAVRAYLQQSP